MDILDLNVSDIVNKTGLGNAAVTRAVMGGNQRINETTAALIADVFGVPLGDIAWPSELTHLGRTPLTGSPIEVRSERKVASGDEVCGQHFVILSGGRCGLCY